MEADGAHGPSVRNRRRLVAADEPLRGRHRPRAADTAQGQDPQHPALARWAATSAPPGALVADGVALVLARLGDGDPDALAAQVMAETPDRFGRNWESGPAH